MRDGSTGRGLVPRKVKGFRDLDPATNALRWRLVETASRVYASYGFEHWDTPLLEYADCLGKYLPESNEAAEGVYAFPNPEREPIPDAEGAPLRDVDNRVLFEHALVTLRYDLTAPLARKYAEDLWEGRKNPGRVPPLFRRFQYGPVFRFEQKLDPGRFREFWQLDFDTVGVSDVTCDAEVAMILSDALEALGLARGTWEIRVNSRNLHQGLFERVGLAGDEARCRDVLRVLDKVDKIGVSGVEAELGAGRVDASGSKVDGLRLDAATIGTLTGYLDGTQGAASRADVLGRLEAQVGGTPSGTLGLSELRVIDDTLTALGYGEDRVVFDPSVARGLAYYTGPVFEAVSKLEVRDEHGAIRRFGSICGGGRYDGLVERMLGVRVPATGASIGVDRLADLLSRVEAGRRTSPVLVLALGSRQRVEQHRAAAELRAAGIPAEVYFGMQAKMKAQLAYADARGCAVAVLLGSEEVERGVVALKDLDMGKKLAAGITDRAEWRSGASAQVEVPRAGLVDAVRELLASRG